MRRGIWRRSGERERGAPTRAAILARAGSRRREEPRPLAHRGHSPAVGCAGSGDTRVHGILLRENEQAERNNQGREDDPGHGARDNTREHQPQPASSGLTEGQSTTLGIALGYPPGWTFYDYPAEGWAEIKPPVPTQGNLSIIADVTGPGPTTLETLPRKR